MDDRTLQSLAVGSLDGPVNVLERLVDEQPQFTAHFAQELDQLIGRLITLREKVEVGE